MNLALSDNPALCSLLSALCSLLSALCYLLPALCSLLPPAPCSACSKAPSPQVNLAYEAVKEMDGLDMSKEGSEAWEAAMKRYNERIDRVESRITARLG